MKRHLTEYCNKQVAGLISTILCLPMLTEQISFKNNVVHVTNISSLDRLNFKEIQ